MYTISKVLNAHKIDKVFVLLVNGVLSTRRHDIVHVDEDFTTRRHDVPMSSENVPT